MSTANTTATTTTQQLIDQRLDAIDRALLGLLPRNERLGLVAQIEAQVRDAAAANPGFENQLPSAADDENNLDGPHSGSGTGHGPHLFAAHRGGAAQAGKKRSQLAITAGVLGIVAIGLLFLTPITYAIVGTIGDAVNEIALYAILGGHVGAVALAGVAAVALGIVALIRFRKLGDGFTGHAWAITGLCTGALPMFIGGLIALVAGLQLINVQGSYCQPVTEAPVNADGPVAYMPPGPDGMHPAGYPTPYTAMPPAAMTEGATIQNATDDLPRRPSRPRPNSDDEPGRAFVRQAGDEVPAGNPQPLADNPPLEDNPDDEPVERLRPQPAPQPTPQPASSALPPAAGQPSPAEPRPSPEGLQRQYQ